MSIISFGRQVCGSLPEATAREWLVADGRGGYAMGTVSGLRTRRYHGLLMVSTGTVGVRRLGLAALDPVLVIGGRRIRLAVHEWVGGTVDPDGFVHLESFVIEDGVPRWRWAVGDVIVDRQLAMHRGRPAVGVVHRVVRAPAAVGVEVAALCTWRGGHGERYGNGPPRVEQVDGGFRFEEAYRVSGPGFRPGGVWYRGVRYRLEAERGLSD
ncbi:MAG: glycogen debranching enzyme N-terminal domain-containing protein, partial [Mycobacteriaceae bacterium]